MSLCPACGAARGKGRFSVPYCCRGTDPRPSDESGSLAFPGSGAGRPEWGEGRAVLGKTVVQAKRRHPSGCLLLSGKAQIGWNGSANWGQRKKPGAPFGSRPLPVVGAVSFDRKLYGITKKGGACVREPQVPATHRAKRKSPPQRAAFGYAKCLGSKRKRHLSVPFFFWCGRWDSNPHTEVLASKTRASTIPPLPLISLWPCTFTKQQADKCPYYTIFSLGLSIPRPVPTVRGLPVYRRCVRIES